MIEKADSGRRPRTADLLVAAGYTVPAVAVGIFYDGGGAGGAGSVVPLLAVLAAGTALLFRRLAPLVSLAATASIMLLTFSVPSSFAAAATAMALYSVAVYRDVRPAVLGLLGISAALGAAAVLVPGSGVDFGQAAQAIAVLVGATLLGLNVRTRRAYVAALADRADRLVREREQLASIAVAAERNAIAREMHDVVAHGLAVMISLAHGSAEIAATDPERAVRAMRQVAETGQVAVSDMRRMLGLLHDGDGGRLPGAAAPAPAVANIPALVELFRSAGLPAALHSSGVPPNDPGFQLAIYRVVQEGLTNALKYAEAATEVMVCTDFAEPTVTDDGKPKRVRAEHVGRGIVGMRERVALFGGTLCAGPRNGGGWRVRARFPR
jgi:signal transduction histidine kinase